MGEMKYDITKVDKSNIKIDEDIIETVEVRYSLTIPFRNRKMGISVGIIMMNPSKANKYISDQTINKLVDFFYDYRGYGVKEITICNVLPVFASNTPLMKEKISLLFEKEVLTTIQAINQEKILNKMKEKDLIVFGWGKPQVKTIHNLYYYREVLGIVNTLSSLDGKELYVFEIHDAISTFTEHGDPRHPGRVTINGLKKISIAELFGLE